MHLLPYLEIYPKDFCGQLSAFCHICMAKITYNLAKFFNDFNKKFQNQNVWLLLGNHLGYVPIDPSLIAKDNKEDLFYEPAMECAKAVHYYIMFALTRHCRREDLCVPRNTTNTLVIDPWIDWLELLEHFLDNPFNAITRGEEKNIVTDISISVTTKGGSLVTLAQK